MKRPIFYILYSIFCVLLVALPVLAQEPLQFEGETITLDDPDDPYGLKKTAIKAGLPETEGGLPTLIGKIIGYALGLLGTLFFVLAVYGGVLWMKARGNEKEVEKAKETLTNAIIGIAIIAAAYAITGFVIDVLSKP